MANRQDVLLIISVCRTQVDAPITAHLHADVEGRGRRQFRRLLERPEPGGGGEEAATPRVLRGFRIRGIATSGGRVSFAAVAPRRRAARNDKQRAAHASSLRARHPRQDR